MKSLYRIAVPMILAFSLTFFIGCSDDDDDGPTGPGTQNFFTDVATIGDTYLSPPNGTKNISGGDLYALVYPTMDEDLFLIDFRSSTHFQDLGHILGAVNWTIADLYENLDQIPTDAKVICICYTGQTASFAACYLNMKGYDAWNLKFGMCGWTNDEVVNRGLWANLTPTGHPTETEAHTLTTEYPFPELMGESADECIDTYCDAYFSREGGLKYITATEVYDNLNDGDDSNDPFLLNYWNEDSYNGGHIPGSFRFGPGLLGTGELLKYVPTEQQVVVWCYTGQTSAQVCTYLNMLGYDAYSLKFGMNAINPALCGTSVYTAPGDARPVVIGPAN